jgi:heavy metal sensor kinase
VNRLPIRVRLAAVFALALAAVLFAAGWFVYARVASDLGRSLDQDLRARAQDLSALVLHGGALGPTRGRLIERGESFAELIAPDATVRDATEPIGSTRLLTRAELERARRGPAFVNRAAVPGLDEPARLLAVPLAGGQPPSVLVVGATRENRAETLSSLRAAFLIGGPLALLLASLGGYLLAAAALRPVEAMRRRAEEISTSSLDERLPVPAARDELSRLGLTLNEMLSRIEDGVERERRFVADASHELRTPLALLKTELELALRHDRSPARLEQAIRSAAAETDRLARIAEDLLLVARSEQGRLPLRLEPADVSDLLETVRGRFEYRAQNAARDVAVGSGPAVVASLDRLRVEQALGNLVDNALRYGGGPVTLTASATNGTLELHVLDEGPGIPRDFLEHAFDRFSRGDNARGGAGTGLGLAIVASIAHAHDGHAHAVNRPKGGADVWISLPGRVR